MKKDFTSKLPTLIIVLGLLLSISGYSQTKHIVSVTSNKFTPKNLTISVGDTVEWRNTQGSHNINGTTSTYPSNPESFSRITIGTNWVYSHVFTISGHYDYVCDPHIAFGMVGTIEVQTTTGIENDIFAGNLKMFPNPAKERVYIEQKDFSSPTVSVKFFDLTGKNILSQKYATNNRLEIDISQMVSGIYFVELSDATERRMMKLVIE